MAGNTPVPDVVDAPTIGTATAGIESASVTFTAAATGGAAASYGAISTPGSVTGTSATSPITISGLTADTSYTFKTYGINSSGTWSNVLSASSNSITALGTAFESIASVNASSSNLISFSSIPQTYKHLQIRYNLKCGQTGSADFDELSMRVNGTTGGYAYHKTRGTSGGSVASDSGTNQSGWSGWILNSNSSLASMFAVGIIDIYDYASTTKTKTMKVTMGYDTGGNLVSFMFLGSLLYPNTTAITSLSFVDNFSHSFASGSSMSLYGIK
jgi:hypothetical protein